MTRKRSTILEKCIKDAGINEPAIVTTSVESRRNPNNRFNALTSVGTISVENDEYLDTLIVGSNAATQEQQQQHQQAVIIEDIEVITIDKMSSNKRNTAGELKRILEIAKRPMPTFRSAEGTQGPNHHLSMQGTKNSGKSISKGTMPLIPKWVGMAG